MYTFILKLYNYAIAPKTFTTIFLRGGGGVIKSKDRVSKLQISNIKDVNALFLL